MTQDMGTFKAVAHEGLKVEVESGGMMFLRAKELRHGSEASEGAFACSAVRWGSALFANTKFDPYLERLEERFMQFKASEKATQDVLSAAARNARVAKEAGSVPAGSGKGGAARCEAVTCLIGSLAWDSQTSVVPEIGNPNSAGRSTDPFHTQRLPLARAQTHHHTAHMPENSLGASLVEGRACIVGENRVCTHCAHSPCVPSRLSHARSPNAPTTHA